jgi:hypothetical protein
MSRENIRKSRGLLGIPGNEWQYGHFKRRLRESHDVYPAGKSPWRYPVGRKDSGNQPRFFLVHTEKNRALSEFEWRSRKPELLSTYGDNLIWRTDFSTFARHRGNSFVWVTVHFRFFQREADQSEWKIIGCPRLTEWLTIFDPEKATEVRRAKILPILRSLSPRTQSAGMAFPFIKCHSESENTGEYGSEFRHLPSYLTFISQCKQNMLSSCEITNPVRRKDNIWSWHTFSLLFGPGAIDSDLFQYCDLETTGRWYDVKKNSLGRSDCALRCIGKQLKNKDISRSKALRIFGCGLKISTWTGIFRHLAGRILLRHVSQHLEKTKRKEDIRIQIGLFRWVSQTGAGGCAILLIAPNGSGRSDETDLALICHREGENTGIWC